MKDQGKYSFYYPMSRDEEGIDQRRGDWEVNWFPKNDQVSKYHVRHLG